MISKPLFKQSIKANRVMWLIITFAVCFILSCVMLIAGGGNIADTKNAIQNTVIEGELTAQIQNRALNYYEITNTALAHFDEKFAEQYAAAYASALSNGKTEEDAQQIAYATAYQNANTDLQTYVATLAQAKEYEADSTEAQELQGLIFYTLNPLIAQDTYMFDSFYTTHGETAPRYDMTSVSSENRKTYREEYCQTNASVFLAGNMVNEDNISNVLEALGDYGVTMEQYHEFGFDDYSKVKGISESVVVNYRANLDYRIANIKEGETVDSIKAELTKSFTSSLLSSLPTEVSDAISEIGGTDLYGLLVGSIFFKMAGLLLPIIYMIMTANALIAGQVDSGSMAYILSTSTKRRTVTMTQALFLISSLFCMFVCTSITSIICLSIVNVTTDLTIGKLLLINLGAFVVMFAMSGICFLASSWFNRSKHSMAIGGGLSMFFLVATMLGLFGSNLIPSVIRMDALNYFNYVSIITLFDVPSILAGSLTFLWKLAILIAIGVICYVVAIKKFDKKDLPL